MVGRTVEFKKRRRPFVVQRTSPPTAKIPPATPAKLGATTAGIVETPSPAHATPAGENGGGHIAATTHIGDDFEANPLASTVATTPSPVAVAGKASMPSFKRRKKFVTVKRIEPSSGGNSATSSSTGGSRKDDDAAPARYFKALFSRPKEYKKKRKKYEDGVLKVQGDKITLTPVENSDTPVIRPDRRHDCHRMRPEFEFEHCRFFVTVEDEVPAEEVLSGRFFIKAAPQTSLPGSSSAGSGKKRVGGTGIAKPRSSLAGAKAFGKPFSSPKFGSTNKKVAVARKAGNDEHVLFSGYGQHDDRGNALQDVSLPQQVTRVLRPHQIEGVEFMYNCVMGFKTEGQFGCILADEMGLGKTLQTLCLLRVLLTQSATPGRRGDAARAVIVCPKTLCQNWEREFKKWRVKLGRGMSVFCVTGGKDAAKQVKDFSGGGLGGGGDGSSSSSDEEAKLTPWQKKRQAGKKMRERTSGLRDAARSKSNARFSNVLVISYELFRKFIASLGPAADIVVCDEGHRLKNAMGNKTIEAMAKIKSRKRVILTGTPIQNDLDEFYAMANFVNPRSLGDLRQFRKVYAQPIAAALDKGATEAEKSLGEMRKSALLDMTSAFMLRRLSSVNDKYLPPREELLVFCRMPEAQEKLYRHVLERCMESMRVSSAGSLVLLNEIRKVASHPDLLLRTMTVAANGESDSKGGASGDDDDGSDDNKPPALFSDAQREASEMLKIFPDGYSVHGYNPQHSGKLAFLQSLMHSVTSTTTDKIVVVSSFTATLGIIGRMCDTIGLRYGVLDGSVSSEVRMQMVDQLNLQLRHQDDPNGLRVLLVSAKAGGTGLNLIGANHLVMFEPDWNPATDAQSMMRVWRDGQKKRVHIYRLFSTGTIDEKILQRQLSKLEMETVVKSGNGDKKKLQESKFTREELRRIFSLNSSTNCETFDVIGRGRHGWSDYPGHASLETGPLRDACMIYPDLVSFVHVNATGGKAAVEDDSIDPQPPASTLAMDAAPSPSPSSTVSIKFADKQRPFLLQSKLAPAKASEESVDTDGFFGEGGASFGEGGPSFGEGHGFGFGPSSGFGPNPEPKNEGFGPNLEPKSEGFGPSSGFGPNPEPKNEGFGPNPEPKNEGFGPSSGLPKTGFGPSIGYQSDGSESEGFV